MFGYWDEERAPWGEAAISKRAEGKLEQAKELFDNHIASVDCTAGPVGPVEIVPFHLVTHAQKQLRDYVKQWGLKPIFTFATVPNRKSKACTTSVIVTPEAQAAFLRDRPGAKERAAAAAAAAAAAKGKGKAGKKENQGPAGGAAGAPAAKKQRV